VLLPDPYPVPYPDLVLLPGLCRGPHPGLLRLLLLPGLCRGPHPGLLRLLLLPGLCHGPHPGLLRLLLLLVHPTPCSHAQCSAAPPPSPPPPPTPAPAPHNNSCCHHIQVGLSVHAEGVCRQAGRQAGRREVRVTNSKGF